MRSTLVVSLSLSLGSLVACGDEPSAADLYLEPLCGEEHAARLLPLDGETIASLERLNEDDDLFVQLFYTEEIPLDSSRSVIVDRCGDEVIELAAGITDVGHMGDALVGCRDGDLVRLSRYDDPAPTLLARRGCASVPVGERWVTVTAEPGAEAGRLVSLAVVGSEVEVRTLVDDVVIHEGFDYFPSVVGGRAFATTTAGALVSADPHTGETAVELEQAEALSIDEDVIAYRAPFPEGQPLAPIVLRDRRTGTEQPLDAEIPTWWYFRWKAPGVLQVTPQGMPSPARWFLLDPVRELAIPEGMEAEKVRTDGYAWLTRRDEASGELSVLRWREGEEPQALLTCTECELAWIDPEADWIDVLVRTGDPERHELWRLDDREGPARMLADGVGEAYAVLDDGRTLTVPGVQHGQWGPLQLFEGPDEPGVTLVDGVTTFSPAFTRAYGGGDILYVKQLGGSRGLFRARLAP